MPKAPREIGACDLGDVSANWALCADVDADGREEVPYGPRPLVCVDLSGKAKWRAGVGGILTVAGSWPCGKPHTSAVEVADVDGDGLCAMVVGCGDGKVRVFK